MAKKRKGPAISLREFFRAR